MNTQKIEKFNIIGISVRTSNENGQATEDIAKLWSRFMTDCILEKIPNKIDLVLYSVYTDYEKDYTKPYTTILGCRVQNLATIPNGMVGVAIEAATYQKFVAKGDLMQGVVYNEWIKIWNSPINRAYTSDFEVYDERAQNPTNAEVDIFIAIR